MASRHTLIIATLFAFAAVAGGVSLARTLDLGAATRRGNDALVAARTHQLNTFERSLHRQLAKAPVVKAPTSNAPQAPAIAPVAPTRAQRVVFVRPKPIIVHKRRAGGAYETEQDDEGEGGFDD